MRYSLDDEGTAVCVDRETCKSFSESHSYPRYVNLFKFMPHNDNRVVLTQSHAHFSIQIKIIDIKTHTPFLMELLGFLTY